MRDGRSQTWLGRADVRQCLCCSRYEFPANLPLCGHRFLTEEKSSHDSTRLRQWGVGALATPAQHKISSGLVAAAATPHLVVVTLVATAWFFFSDLALLAGYSFFFPPESTTNISTPNVHEAHTQT